MIKKSILKQKEVKVVALPGDYFEDVKCKDCGYRYYRSNSIKCPNCESMNVRITSSMYPLLKR